MRTSPPPPGTGCRRAASNPGMDDELWLTPDQLGYLAGSPPEGWERDIEAFRQWRDGTYFENNRPPHLAAREDEA